MTDFAQPRGSFTSVRAIAAWIAVLAVHWVLVALLLASQSGPASLPRIKPIELILVPPARISKPPGMRESSAVSRQELAIPAPIAPFWPAPTPDSSGPNIDWGNEAEEAAKAFADGQEFRSLNRQQPSEAAGPIKSIFPDLAAHHAGEQFRTGDGRWAVFVSEECYQVSDSLASPDALNNGMGVQTYCIGRSREPRGDLFDQLAIYKKLHPAGAAPAP